MSARQNGERTVTRNQSPPDLVRRRRPACIPLSSAQMRFWLTDRMQGQSPEYNQPVALRLRGHLSNRRLLSALQAIVNRHEILRTTFLERAGHPIQRIATEFKVKMPLTDLRQLSREAQEEEIEFALIREWSIPFALATAPPFRARLLRLQRDEHVLIRTFHHIASDRWSHGVFNHELSSFYSRPGLKRGGDVKPLTVQYADYALWQHQQLDGDRLEAGLSFWSKRFADPARVAALPTDRPRPRMKTTDCRVLRFKLSRETSTEVESASRRAKVTKYTWLLSALAVLMARHGGSQQVAIASPFASRGDPHLDDLIGCFVHSVVIRALITEEMRFADLVTHLRSAVVEAYEYRAIPLHRILERLPPGARNGVHRLSQVMLSWQGVPWAPVRLEGLDVEQITTDTQASPSELEIYATDEGDALTLAWVYNVGLFDEWRIRQLATHYERLLGQLSRDPQTHLARVNLMTTDESLEILRMSGL